MSQVKKNVSSRPLLVAENVSVEFGGIKALNGVSFELYKNELVALIGPNGAGKTTLFNVLTGVYRPTRGAIYLDGTSLINQTPDRIVQKGLTRTFQNIRLFKNVSVLDNVKTAAQQYFHYGLGAALLNTRAKREEEAKVESLAEVLITQMGLAHRMWDEAQCLPYGEQRRLEIARALMTGAKTILLDEPAAGMNERETQTLMHDLKEIRQKFDLTFLLIEHDMRLVMGISERIIVLDHGMVIAEGSPLAIRENPLVIKAYLGQGAALLASTPKDTQTSGYAVRSFELKPPPLPDSAQKNNALPLLKVSNLHVKYGPIHALKGVSLEVYKGEIVSLVGSNGAGKSTLLKAISAMVACQGDIRFNGRHQLTWSKGLTPEAVVRSGIAHAPEGRRIFADLTVEENLRLGAYLRAKDEAIERDLIKCMQLFPRLKERLWQRAGTLSGGEQQMLAIGRALMASPEILLLDEPSLGLAPKMIEQIFSIILDIQETDTTVLLIEQNAYQALQISHRAYVLETGELTISGPAQELISHPSIQAAYLGA